MYFFLHFFCFVFSPVSSIDEVVRALQMFATDTKNKEDSKGLKTLLQEALQLKPLEDIPNPLGLDWVEDAKNWNLESQLNSIIKAMLPPKTTFTFNVADMMYQGIYYILQITAFLVVLCSAFFLYF